MAKRQFDATIVFMAVAGEEQGLYGSTFFAQQAKAAGATGWLVKPFVPDQLIKVVRKVLGR